MSSLRNSIPRLGAIAALALAGPLAAQQAAPREPELIGRIVAIVGDSVITNIDMQEALTGWRAQTGRDLPAPGPELDAIARQVLDARIDQLMLVQAAQQDTTLKVADEQVNAAVDSRLDQLRRQFGGDAGLEQALSEAGLTLAAYRQNLATQQRRDVLIQAYLRKVQSTRKPPPVTEEEIDKFWDEQKENIGRRPATITFRQVVVSVQPSDSALGVARALADSLLQKIVVDKEDFALLARRFSEDPGSKDVGGDLGWFRQGTMYREFERAVFSPALRPGDVTGPVRTAAGFHIIKLEKIRGPERQARHILIRPEITAADRERARDLAASLADSIRAGTPVDSLAHRYGDPDELVRVGPWQRDSLPEPYDKALAGAAQDQVIGPFELDAGGGTPSYVVAKITEVEAERPATLDDYRPQIRDRLAQDKLMDELLADLRRRTFVDVRLDDSGG